VNLPHLKVHTEHTDPLNLLAIAKGIVNNHRRGSLEFGDIGELVTYDLIAQHVIAEDKQYFGTHREAA
jgi:hypothetical protein